MSAFNPSPYLSLFVEESREYLALLNDKLLSLETDAHPRAALGEIFRAAHTLKGMSATMGFTGMAELTHAMESVLDEIRSERRTLTRDCSDLLFLCVDALSQALEAVAVGMPDAIDPGLIAKISGVAEAPAEAAASGAIPLPALDPFEWTVLEEARNKGLKPFWVTIRLSESCLLKGVRAYMVLTAIEQHGEILKAVPAVPELEEERFERDFAVIVVSPEDAEAIKAAVLEVSEIEHAEANAITQLPAEVGQAHPTEPELTGVVPAASVDAAPQAAASPARSESPSEKPAVPHEAPHEARQQAPHDAMPAAKTEAKPPEAAGARTIQTIRVPTDRLDRLVNLVGELVIDRNRLVENGGKVPELAETIRHIGGVISELQNVAMKLRMTPVERVFSRFPRMIRDLSRELGKEVVLHVEGQETELDRLVIDEIGEPLVHLLRNALDHGIEPPEERRAAGKSSPAVISLSARHEGNHVIIQVADDGGGIDPQRVAASAVSKGLLTEDEAARLSEKQAFELLFAPGFSTREAANSISGRGVGMDAVKAKVLSLGGAVEITSRLRQGSTITVLLPLTLAIIQAMLVEVGGAIFALPMAYIEEALDLVELSVQWVQDSEMVILRGHALSLTRLDAVLGLSGVPTGEEAVLVVRIGSKKVGLVVDRLLGQQEVVIKPISRLVGKLDHLSGAAILGDGRLALILDTVTLV